MRTLWEVGRTADRMAIGISPPFGLCGSVAIQPIGGLHSPILSGGAGRWLPTPFYLHTSIECNADITHAQRPRTCIHTHIPLESLLNILRDESGPLTGHVKCSPGEQGP